MAAVGGFAGAPAALALLALLAVVGILVIVALIGVVPAALRTLAIARAGDERGRPIDVPGLDALVAHDSRDHLPTPLGKRGRKYRSGERYNVSHWPSPPSNAHYPENPVLGPIPALHEAVPVETEWSPSDKREARTESLLKQVAAWRHNRQVYPGWLIAPHHIRDHIWERSSHWFHRFDDLSDLTPRQRLEAFVELGWLLDLCLFPLFRNLEQGALEALEAVDLASRRVGDEVVADWGDWSDLMAMSDRLALALSRNGRHANDRVLFDRAIGRLSERARHDPGLFNAITYEECLWDSGTGDLISLTKRLNRWTTVQSEPLWLLRKAGLLAELGEDARACETLEHALGAVRRGRRREIDDIPALSLESWAMYLALGYERRRAFEESDARLSPDQPQPFDRWRVLGELECDAWSDFQALHKVLQARKKPTPAVTERRGFDLHHVSTTHHLSSGYPESKRAAYAVLLVSEITGIPPAARNTSLLEPALNDAAHILADDEPWVAAHLAIRMKLSSSKQDTLIDRRWVARLSLEMASSIRDSLLRRIAFMLDRSAASPRIEDINDIAACLELLSRVAVRLPPSELTSLITEALAFHRAPVLGRFGHQLWPPLNNLLRRVLEALPGSSIVQLLPALFKAPLPSGAENAGKPLDPVQALPDWFDALGYNVTRDATWHPAILNLLTAVAGTGSTRAASVARLQKLYDWRLLDEQETRLYADALWAPDRLTADGLPDDTNFYPWVAMRMPEQIAGQARKGLAVRMSRLLSQEGDPTNTVVEVADQVGPLSREDPTFALDEQEVVLIRRLLLSWCAAPLPRESGFHRAFSSEYPKLRLSVVGAATLSQFLPTDAELRDALWRKREELEDHAHLPGTAMVLYSALARFAPERASELIFALRRGLASDNQAISSGALSGLFRWLFDTQADDDGVSRIDLDETVLGLVRDLAACRQRLLPGGLNLIRWIFSSGPSRLRDKIAADSDQALVRLIDLVAYDVPNEDLDVPAIRAAAVSLALAMAQDGRSDLPGVATWLATAPADPLPEVRHAGAGRGGAGLG